MRHGYVYPLGRALGVEDKSIGDAVFDDRFVIKTNDVPFARAWLSPVIRARLLELVDRVAVSLDDGELRIVRLSAFDPPAERQRAVDLAGWIAGRGGELLGEWRALAAKLDGRVRAVDGCWAADGSAAVELDWQGTPKCCNRCRRAARSWRACTATASPSRCAGS
jgi:hypothetical protein